MSFSSEQIKEFRQRIPDTSLTNPAFSDIELEAFLEQSVLEHSQGERSSINMLPADWPLSLLLAHSSVMYNLATSKVRFFKWIDGEESVDKSMISENCIKVANSLLQRYRMQHNKKMDEKEQGVNTSFASRFWKM